MKKEEEAKIIVFRESLIQSVLADIFTFGVLVASFAINHYFIGSKFLSAIILIVWFIWVLGKGARRKHTFTNKKKAIEFLET